MDTEGVNLGFGQLTIIQISIFDTSTNTQSIFILDILADVKLLSHSKLIQMLQDESIIKVFHDGRADYYQMKKEFNLTIRGMFDVQIGYAVLTKGSSISAGLNTKVCRRKAEYKKEDIRVKLAKIERLFAMRPLTEDVIEYCALDVKYLHLVYEKMCALSTSTEYLNL